MGNDSQWDRERGQEWGRRYLMVPPDHFRIDYAINPYMRLEDQPEPDRTWRQFEAIRAAIEAAGGTVETLAQLPDAPDMVYAMNLGLAVGDTMVVSHMRHPQRRGEAAATEAWATGRGLRTLVVGRAGVGAHFEAGDAFPWRGDLLVGFGPRTEELALKHLAVDLGITVRGFRVTDPAMYHLDLSFCPLDGEHALICPAAYDDASAEALLALIPAPLVLSREEALTFCANSVVVGRTVIMPACPDRVRAQLEEWGFDIVLVDTSEYLKGGGSIRCLTNPLDIRLGRDLAPAPGRVLLPRA